MSWVSSSGFKARELADSLMRRVSLPDVHNLCSTALRLAGLNERSVAAIADTVRDAERDGCKSHGLFRLKGFCDGIRSGKCDPVALPIIVKDAPGAVTVDAQRGFSSLAFRVSAPPCFRQPC